MAKKKIQHSRITITLTKKGDFWEAYNDDAKIVSYELNVVLRANKSGVYIAAFPHHALEENLKKLMVEYNIAMVEEKIN